MCNDPFDPFESAIHCGFGIGQHVGTVEDVQPLVFHRAGVEIINGHDVKNIQIIFAPIGIFVPCHRFDERVHRKFAFVLIALAHVNTQINGAT